MKRFVSVLMFAFVCGCMMSAVADTYVLNDSNTTVNNPTIADNGSTNAIVSSSASGKITYTTGTMTIVGDSTINNTNRLELQAAIVSNGGPYTITKTNSGQLLFENDSSAVGKIVINGSGQVVAQNNANAINAINGVDLNSGQLQIWNLQNVTGTIYANGGSIQSDGGTNSFIGNIVLNEALNINVNTATFTTTGSITSTSNKTITKSGAGTWEIKGSVTCGQINYEQGEIKVSTGGSLTGTALRMRDAGQDYSQTYTLTVDGGSASFSGSNALGHWPSNYGVVNLKSGTLTMSGTTDIGLDGKGKLTQSGGTATFGTLRIRDTGSSIEFSGGTTSITELVIGRTAKGDEASGAVTFKGTNSATIGNIYTYQQGTINIQDSASITVNGGAYFGQTAGSYTCTINQSGGTFTSKNDLALGHYTNTNAKYNISGGTLNVLNYNSSAGQSGLWMAVDGDGTLNQSGGTVNAGRINLNARDTRNTGTYNMTGGTLNVGTGGIMATQSGSGRYSISLKKGTITAGSSELTANKGNWSSSLNMSLTGTKTDSADERVTFKPESGYSITLSGTLSGDGGLIKDGAGSMTLSAGSGGNTYTGGTKVTSGTLYLKGTNNGYSSVGYGDLVIESGAKVEAQSHNVIGHGGGKVLSNVIINGGTFLAYQYLQCANFELNSGTINYTSGGGGTGLCVGSRNPTFKSTGNSIINAPIENSDTLTINVADGTLSLTNTISNGSGKTIKTGVGTLTTSSGINDNIEVQEGTLKLTGTFNTGCRFKGTITISEGATLDCAAHDSLGYNGNWTYMNVYGTVDNSVGNETLDNMQLNLYGGTVKSSSGGNLDILNDGVSFNSYALTGATAEKPTVSTISSKVRMRTDGTFNITTAANSQLNISGEIFTGSGSCAVKKLGDGTLKLTAQNTYTNDTYVNGGVLDLTEGKLYHGKYYTANLYINEGGTLIVNNFGYSENGNSSLGGLTYTSGKAHTHFNGGTIRITETYSSDIQRLIDLQEKGGTFDIDEGVEVHLSNTISGAGMLTKTGKGLQILSAQNTYEGGTTISDGTLKLTGNGTVGTGAVTLDGGTLEFAYDSNKSFNNTITTNAGKTGTIIKSDSNTLLLNGTTDNPITATSFTVDAGSLLFKGNYAGDLKVNNGALMSPGNSVGTLTVDGNVTFNAGSTLLLEQDSTGMDQLILTAGHTLTLDEDSILALSMGSVQPGASYAIFTNQNGLTEEQQDVSYWTKRLTTESAYYWNLSIDKDLNTVFAQVDPNAVPEPSTWALLILGVAGLVWLKRNEKREARSEKN